MDIDKVINGYLRLFRKIYEIPDDRGMRRIPKPCRVCGGDVDFDYWKRNKGYLCRDCFEKERARKHKIK